MTMPGTDSFAPEGDRSSMRDQVRGIKDQALEQGRTSLRDARDRAASSLGESKGRVAEQIGAVASAFRQAGDQLRAQSQSERIAGLTDAMARQADQAADYLRRADSRMLQQDVERLTRRQPALVLGGAFVAGLIGARFLKSSERRRHDDEYGYGSDEGVYRTPGSTLPASYPPDYTPGSSGYGSGTSGYVPGTPDYSSGYSPGSPSGLGGSIGGPDAGS